MRPAQPGASEALRLRFRDRQRSGLRWRALPPLRGKPVPYWVARSANTPCKIIPSPSLNRHLDSGEGRKRELIDSCCFPNNQFIYSLMQA